MAVQLRNDFKHSGAWIPDAACYENEEAEYAFFTEPVSQKRDAVIARFCHTCPVRTECGEYGRASKSVGVWGGQFMTFSATYNPKDTERGPEYKKQIQGELREDLRKVVVDLYDRSGATTTSVAVYIKRSPYLVKALLAEAGVVLRPSRREAMNA